jgi:hypothetical protein
MLLAGMGAVALAACGSDVATVSGPDLVLGSGQSSADAVAASADSFPCQLVGPLDFAVNLTGSSSASVSGNETLQCRGTVTPAPDKTLFFDGLPCFLPETADWTSNSHLTLHSNGAASLRCQAK